MRNTRFCGTRRWRCLPAVVIVILLAACGGNGPDQPTTTMSTGSPPTATSTEPPTTITPTTTSVATFDTTMPDGLAAIDALCDQAVGAVSTIPVHGDSPEDFAIEEHAVSEILHSLALSLSAAGAGDLALAAEAYAESRAGLAVAYDEGLMEGVNAALTAVDEAAAELVAVSTAVGSTVCAGVPDAG